MVNTIVHSACAAVVCGILVSTATAVPYVGSRTFSIRSDDNIGDGVQVQAESVEATISHNGGDDYTLDFTSPDADALAMTREGDWLKLTAPQSFAPGSTIHEAAVVSDASGGAMILYVQDTFPGASPDDYSVAYSVWSDVTPDVSADDLAGQWQLVEYGQPNLLHDASPFTMSQEILTVVSLGGNRIEVQGLPDGARTMQIVGNELVFEGDAPWYDGRMLMTEDHLFYGTIGVEDDDATDIALTAGYLSRIPEPATLAMLGFVALLIRRRRPC